MTQQTVKFTRGGSSTTFGNFAPGDVLRCAADMARHLVDEVQCAVYVQAPAQADADPIEPPGADDVAEASDIPVARRRGRPPKYPRVE